MRPRTATESREDQRQRDRRTLPSIATPVMAPSAAPSSERRPLRERESQEHDRRRDDLVEDLPVHVHVVPDDVRLERDRERRDEPARAEITRRPSS